MAAPNNTPGAAQARGFLLRRDGRGYLGLHDPAQPRVQDVIADWLGPEQQRRLSGGKQQLLARAAGVARRSGLQILDATGGLGRDAHLLAHLGAAVTVCEREPLIFALLEDAWLRLELADAACAKRITLVPGDARNLLAGPPRWDVVYLDPMYPDQDRKSALPGREMQLFRRLTGGDDDADALLHQACAVAPRVVVKRPRNAGPLAGQPADQSLKGTQARFDLYLRANLTR